MSRPRIYATREEALAAAKEQRRAWHHRHKAAGRCPRCKQPHTGRMWYCRTCRQQLSKAGSQTHRAASLPNIAATPTTWSVGMVWTMEQPETRPAAAVAPHAHPE